MQRAAPSLYTYLVGATRVVAHWTSNLVVAVGATVTDLLVLRGGRRALLRLGVVPALGLRGRRHGAQPEEVAGVGCQLLRCRSHSDASTGANCLRLAAQARAETAGGAGRGAVSVSSQQGGLATQAAYRGSVPQRCRQTCDSPFSSSSPLETNAAATCAVSRRLQIACFKRYTLSAPIPLSLAPGEGRCSAPALSADPQGVSGRA